MFKSKLGRKIISIVLTAVTLVTISVGYLTFHFSKLFLDETVIERYTQLTSETLNHIDSFIFERDRSARLLATSHTPKHFLTELDSLGDSPAHPIGGVIEDLNSFGVDFTIWNSASLLDKEAVIQASSRLDLVGTKFAELSPVQFVLCSVLALAYTKHRPKSDILNCVKNLLSNKL